MPLPERTATLRLGTRGSVLARTQSRIVADALEKRHPGVHVDLVTIRTSGDRVSDRPLYDVGGKGLFTKELEQALLAGEIDFAVHSYKDVPVTMPLVEQAGLVIAAVPTREDWRDVLVSEGAKLLEELAPRARLGTSSLRRKCQVLELRPDLVIEPLRGNIDTRLRKVRERAHDAIILAAAGVRRAGLLDGDLMTFMPGDSMLPAPGQGALALQCRKDDTATREALAALNDPDAAECVEAERALVAALAGDCHSPIAALATVEGDRLSLRAAVGGRDGVPPVLRASATVARGEGRRVVTEVAAALEALGVREHLRGPTP